MCTHTPHNNGLNTPCHAYTTPGDTATPTPSPPPPHHLNPTPHTTASPPTIGFGGSDKPIHETYSPSLWATQVTAFLAEVVQRPAVLVGNSIGSQVVAATAAQHPTLVAGLCLLNCTGRFLFFLGVVVWSLGLLVVWELVMWGYWWCWCW